jgi:hypothetical protein
MNRYASNLKGAALVALVVGLTWCFNVNPAFSQERPSNGSPQPNIPTLQRDFDNNLVTSTTGGCGIPVPNTIVSVPFDDVQRRCVVVFSTEAQATANDRCNVCLSIDGAACSASFGPEFFATNEQSFTTHTAQFVALVGAGAHNFRPCFGFSVLAFDLAADNCQFFFRTTTVECYAN